MTSRPDRFPGYWRFIWMFFMQPILLHDAMENMGIDTEASFWQLWRKPASRRGPWWPLLRRSAFLLLVFIPMATAGAGAIGMLAGMAVPWRNLAVGTLFGVCLGAFLSLGIGLTVGVVLGIAFGAIFGLAGGLASVPGGNLLFGVLLGIGGGLAFGVARGLAGGGAVRVTHGLLFAVGAGVAMYPAGGVNMVLAGGLATAAGMLRIPVYFLESLWSVFLLALPPGYVLRLLPVRHHDLSYFPHPFLRTHLQRNAGASPAELRRVLADCVRAPGQDSAGQWFLAHLQRLELVSLAASQDWQTASMLKGEWLPGTEGAEGLLRRFADAGSFLLAASTTHAAHIRRQHARRAVAVLDEMKNMTPPAERNRKDRFREWAAALPAWHQTGTALLEEAERAASKEIPQVFRAGDPLMPGEGEEVFRGRQDIVHEIQEILADTNNHCSLTLLGPRRCGKSSLLRMLPTMLPDTVCVFFDLQEHPVSGLASFCERVVSVASEAAADKRTALPPLASAPGIEALRDWFEELEHVLPPQRLLLCIDEFERLPDLLPGSQQEFRQLMGLFRAVIQHRRNVRLLVSGVAGLDELDMVWADHFINARELRLRFLEPAEALDLLMHPIDDFRAIPEPVARKAIARTGCQPYLTQFFGARLVSRLNRESRKEATLDDVETAELDILAQGKQYFTHTIGDTPPGVRDILLRLANGEAPELSRGQRRWLNHRCLITPENELAIPIFGRWLREEYDPL